MTTRSSLIHLFNAVGNILRCTGLSLVCLEEQDLLKRAQQQTGLSDFGDDSFREPLRLLIKACDQEARLTLIGRLAFRTDTLRFLTNRLRLIEDRKRYNQIALQAIRQPIFIVGLPRTGSTLLHRLLGQDPANRVPLTWEVMFPSPPPELGKSQDDPRIAKTQKLLKFIDRLAPRFKVIHPMDARFATECVGILGHAFASYHFRNMYDIPSYQRWLNDADLIPAYKFHRQFLQQLQWRCPAERWVLKAPPHLFALKAIFEIYPDARIIWTHRHPKKVLASVVSLDTTLRHAFSDHQDPQAIGRENLAHFAGHLRRAMLVRDSPGPWQDRLFDVHYDDLMKDPIGQVHQIYHHLDLTLTNAVVAKMEQFLTAEPKNKRGVHTYSLESFGLNAEMITAHFHSYIERFRLNSAFS